MSAQQESGNGGRAAGTQAAPDPQDLEVEVVRLRQRLEELEAGPPPSGGHRVRRIATVVLVVVTALMVALTSVSVWLRSTLFDTDRFVATVEPALRSPEVADAIGNRLTTEVLTALDLQDRLATALSGLGDALGAGLADALELTPEQTARIQSLPLPQLEQLAGPIAGGIETRVGDLVARFVESPEFQTLLVDVTATAHTRAVALARGDESQLPNLVVEGGEVQVNLVPAVARIISQLADEGLAAIGIDQIPFIDGSIDPQAAATALASALGVDLPPDFGQITVMSEQQLTELQDAVAAGDQLVWAMVVVSVLLVAGTVLVAPRRRRVLVQLGVGTAVAAFLVMLLLRNAQDNIASQAPTPEGQAAAAVLADAILDSLRTTMIVVVVVAALVALVAYLAGRPAWLRRSATAVRRATAAKPGGSDLERAVARYDGPLRVAVIAVGVVVLAWWGITLLSIVVVAALVLLLVWGIHAASERVGAAAAPVPADAEEREPVGAGVRHAGSSARGPTSEPGDDDRHRA